MFYCSSETVICQLFDYLFMDLDDIHTLYLKFTPGHILFFECHANVNSFWVIQENLIFGGFYMYL